MAEQRETIPRPDEFTVIEAVESHGHGSFSIKESYTEKRMPGVGFELIRRVQTRGRWA